MASEIDPKLVTKLAGIIKKEPGNSERFYAEKSGIPMGQILRYSVLAELEADPTLKLPATPAGIVRGKDELGLRWPRVAARAGVTEQRAKELYEQKKGAGSAASAYSGRGRRTFDGAATGTSGRRGAKASSSSKKTSASSKTGTSGRRGAKSASAKTKTAAAAPRGRRGTRSSAASDPK